MRWWRLRSLPSLDNKYNPVNSEERFYRSHWTTPEVAKLGNNRRSARDRSDQFENQDSAILSVVHRHSG